MRVPLFPFLARAGALAATGCLVSCSAGGAGAPPAAVAPGPRAPVQVAVAVARALEVQRTVTVVGTLYGDEEATISNKVAGRIRTIRADIGDTVTAGAELGTLELDDFQFQETSARRSLESVLARLGVTTTAAPGGDPAALPIDKGFDIDKVATVARSIAQRENAKAKLARYVELRERDKGFVTEQQLEDAQTEAAVAEAEVAAQRLAARSLVADAHQRQADVEIAHRRLLDAHIRVPPAGDTPATPPGGARSWSVAARFASEGEYVREGTPLFKVVAARVLKLRAAVPERFAAEVKRGQEARVRVEAWKGREFPGEVSRVSPAVDVQSRTFAVEIAVPNERGELMPGFFARADILTRREQAVLAPIDAIVSFAGVTKVFELGEAAPPEHGPVARERIVTLGPRHDAEIEVVGPVSPGARVLVRGQTVVSDGAPVALAGAARP